MTVTILVLTVITGIVLILVLSSSPQNTTPPTRSPGAQSTATGLPPIIHSHPPARAQTPRGSPAPRQNRDAVNRSIRLPPPAFANSTLTTLQFPHCPKCWCKNRPGETQTVFMLNSDTFRCERGHRFRRNGTLI